jgi:hypothetical protein
VTLPARPRLPLLRGSEALAAGADRRGWHAEAVQRAGQAARRRT